VEVGGTRNEEHYAHDTGTGAIPQVKLLTGTRRGGPRLVLAGPGNGRAALLGTAADGSEIGGPRSRS